MKNNTRTFIYYHRCSSRYFTDRRALFCIILRKSSVEYGESNSASVTSLPPLGFIRKAVLSGVYKTAHKPVEVQGRQEEVKLTLPKEYFVVALNPPIPMPPKVPRKL